MNQNFSIVGNHIELTKLPKSFKKITATRFATIHGLNAWSTPFEAWCAITRTYEKPFEETKSTKAGKIIEGKIIKYLQEVMFLDIKAPADIYGKDYFNKTRGDFFPDEEVLGGMWDAIGEDDELIVEIKTTKRPEDWQLDVPIYYKLQAALYAYLKGWDNIMVPVAFLTEEDLDHPEDFVPNAKNTKIYEFKLSEDFPTFRETYVEPALDFWAEHVLTGVSPAFDEKQDAEILKQLRMVAMDPAAVEGVDIQALLNEADILKENIDTMEATMKPKKDRLKEIDDLVKIHMTQAITGDMKQSQLTGKKFTWTLTKTEISAIDSAAVKKVFKEIGRDIASVSKTTTTYTLKKAEIKEE